MVAIWASLSTICLTYSNQSQCVFQILDTEFAAFFPTFPCLEKCDIM